MKAEMNSSHLRPVCSALTPTNSPSLNENVKGYNRLKKTLQLYFLAGLCLKTESTYELQLKGFLTLEFTM